MLSEPCRDFRQRHRLQLADEGIRRHAGLRSRNPASACSLEMALFTLQFRQELVADQARGVARPSQRDQLFAPIG